jgi:hypothetical protein
MLRASYGRLRYADCSHWKLGGLELGGRPVGKTKAVHRKLCRGCFVLGLRLSWCLEDRLLAGPPVRRAGSGGYDLESYPRASRFHDYRRSRTRGAGWAELGSSVARGVLPGQCRDIPDGRAGLRSLRLDGRVPIGVTVAGAALMLSGQVLFAVAKRENAFFSSTVRIQTERGHQVCERGCTASCVIPATWAC